MQHLSEAALRQAFDLAREHIRSEETTPVRPYIAPGEAYDALDIAIPDEAVSFDDIVEKLRRLMLATPTTASKRFFNQLFAGRDAVATMADMLVTVANISMYTWKVAGPQILVEREVIERMARLVGFDRGEGMFCPGGSLSNMVALILARNEMVPEARGEGLPGDRLRVYSSEESHYSIVKGAGMIGVGRGNVVRIACDDQGRMDPTALERAIRADVRAGFRPICINATAGTTVEGAFDPIRDIASVARAHGVWLHVDGAYGGALLLSERRRHLLDGCELADSFTWDAHKMMGVPLTCSVALTREPGLFEKHFCEPAEYLFQDESDEFNPGTRSIQCGRRNDALKLWAAWQCTGDAGYERRVERLLELTRYAVGVVHADPALTLAREPQSVNVCFEVDGKCSATICHRLDREARMKVGWGVVGGRRTIRVVFLDPEITEADIDVFFDEVKSVAAELPEGDNAMKSDSALAGA